VEFFEQPGHVLAEGLHGAEGFFVLLDFAFVAADADVLVTRAGDDHLADEEEVVERVEGVHGAGPADRHHGRAHLALEHVVVGPGDEAGPVDQGFHLGGHVGEVGGRGEDDAVGGPHLLDAGVDDVVIEDALLILVLEALAAGGAAVDVLACQLDQFRFDAFFLQFGEDPPDQDGRVAVLG
jgi:hypothetical protein